MQNPARKRWHLISLPTILAACCYSPNVLAQVDTSEWICQYCPFPAGYEADIEVGASYVTDDAFRFGNATGLDEAGGYIDVGGSGRYDNEGYQLNWFAEDLGLDSRVFEIDGGRQGRFGFNLGYSELPYRLFDSTSTVFTPTSADTLVLPAGWVTASLTSGFTELTSSLQPQNIESDRRTLTAGADFNAATNVSVFVDYRHQERDGIDIVSGPNLTQASLLPRVLDFETDTVDFGVKYSKGALSMELAWYGSFFKNNVNSLTWDNPFTPFPGAEQGRLAQEPDNEFQQLSFSGAYVADSINSVIAFSAAMGQGEQTARLLPYTINPTMAAGNLPRASLDGKVDTTNYALTLTSRPLPKARIKLAYRYDERDNQTAQSLWSRVIVDSFPSAESELNTPYSFERSRFSISGGYRLFGSVDLSAGYDRTDLDRDFQEVAEQSEDTGWGRARFRVADWLEVIAKGGTSRREIDNYDTDLAMSLGQNPLLRKYNLAYRYREFGELTASISPSNMSLSVGLSARFSDDSYSHSELGLTDGDTSHFTADLNYAVSEKASIYLFGGFEDIEAIQLGSATFSTPTWQANHEDRFDHYGAGLLLRQIGARTDLSLDYLFTEGDTRINMSNGGTNAPFPALESELQSLRLKMRFQKSERLDIDLNLRYESFKTRDWAIEGVAPDTIQTVLTLGADPYDYDVWVIGLGFRYLIGARDISFPE